MNPSAAEPSDLDIPKLFRQIRSRYKVLCATLGTKPSVRAGGLGASQGGSADSGDAQMDVDGVRAGGPSSSSAPNPVWRIDGAGTASQAAQTRNDTLSF